MNKVIATIKSGEYSFKGNFNYIMVYNKYFTLALRKDRTLEYVTEYCREVFKDNYHGVYSEEIEVAYGALLSVTDIIDNVIFGDDTKLAYYLLPYTETPNPGYKNIKRIQPYIYKGYSKEQLKLIDICISEGLDVSYLLYVSEDRISNIDIRILYELERNGVRAYNVALNNYTQDQQEVIRDAYLEGINLVSTGYSHTDMIRYLRAFEMGLDLNKYDSITRSKLNKALDSYNVRSVCNIIKDIGGR